MGEFAALRVERLEDDVRFFTELSAPEHPELPAADDRP